MKFQNFMCEEDIPFTNLVMHKMHVVFDTSCVRSGKHKNCQHSADHRVANSSMSLSSCCDGPRHCLRIVSKPQGEVFSS